MMKCPYKVMTENKEGIGENDTNPQANILSAISNHSEMTVCPYKFNNSSMNNNNNQDLLATTTIDYSEEADEGEYTGGCPVLHTAKKELQTDFKFYFEIPCRGKNDFYFEISGEMSSKEFAEKTEKLRTMPRHLRNTIFHTNNEQLKKIRSKEFTLIYIVYEEIREKAMKLYKQQKYREALAHFNYAYSCFKWIEFRNSERNMEGVLESHKLQPIMDEDITMKRIKTDESFTYEETTYKSCLVSLLKSMSFSYMHLRHFSEALLCINEAIDYSDNKVPELYLRRSQARMYNKNSTLEHLTLALNDIKKAKEMNPEEDRFETHLHLLLNLIEDKKAKELERIHKLFSNAKYAYNKIKEKNLDINNHVYDNYEQTKMNCQVLEEMWKKYKYSLKFYTEANDEKQLGLAYKEIESFKEVYVKFKWYYTFDIHKLPKYFVETLSEDDRTLMKTPNFQRLISDFKFKSCEEVFSNAQFNDDLLKYALNKIIEEAKVQKEISKKYGNKFENKWEMPNLDFLKTKKGLALASTILILASFSMIFLHYFLYSKDRGFGFK